MECCSNFLFSLGDRPSNLNTFRLISQMCSPHDPHSPIPFSVFAMNATSIPMHTRNPGFVLSPSPKSLRYPAQNPAISKSARRPILHRTCSTPNLKTVCLSAIPKRQHVRTYTNMDSTSVQKLAVSLASAFEHDPLFNYICTSNEISHSHKYRIVMEAALNLELSRPAGQTAVHVSEDDGTVAIWHHVGHWKMPFPMQVQFVIPLFRALGWDALRFVNLMQVVEEAHPIEPHMHLFIIGTDEATRGKGNGSRVISKMLQQCDREVIPVYLESSNEMNLTFYRKHGFEVLRKIPGLPEDCPPVFAMWRTPHSVQQNGLALGKQILDH